ncbi:MAG: hypothetical protein WCB19_07860 [Thermoplasmata archaeon]
MNAAITSVRVSRETLAELLRFKEAMGAGTADEALRVLLKRRRSDLTAALYGSARGRLRPFTEADRLDSDR